MTTYTSHRFPLSFVRREGWRARFEPPTGKSTVRWGETEVDDGIDAYDYGAPDEPPYYIYDKIILYVFHALFHALFHARWTSWCDVRCSPADMIRSQSCLC